MEQEVNLTSENPPVLEEPSSDHGKKHPTKIMRNVVILMFVVGVCSVFAVTYQKKVTPKDTNIRTLSPTPASVSQTPVDGMYATGFPVLADLKLLKFAQGDLTTVQYYDLGTIPSGTYKGYKRILAEESQNSPSGQRKYLFATKDDKTYIAQGNPDDAKLYPLETDWNNPYYNLNKEKVSTVDDLLDSLPEQITLDSTFSLFRDGSMYPYTDTRDSEKKYENGMSIPEEYFVTDFSSYNKLSVNDSLRKYYYKNLAKNPVPSNGSDKTTEEERTKEQYLAGTTEVIVVDSQGLAYGYTIATPQAIKTYLAQKKQYDIDSYKARSNTNGNSNYPTEYPMFPNIQFKKSDMLTSESVYDSYNTAFPHACGGGVNTYIVKNVSDNDLVKIGTVLGKDVFALKSPTQKLLDLEYQKKVNIGSETGDSFAIANPKVPQPTLEQYIAKHPLLFMKDYWGRTMVFGEYDYKLMGGCGKPVVYLYPPKPTEVKVMFDSAMQFDTNIPTYHHGWKVLARPDGTLTDLQPQFTDCDTINSTHVGSEYAKDACKANSYPYLYWSGKSLDHVYPSVTEGWVVRKSELADFMSKTLDTIGFTKQEKTDMLAYWIPAMFSKQAPYYRVAFLQTAQMNSLVPMIVTPRPDSIYRLFLDWSPLVSKPATPLTPQVLSTVNRHGFTLVEWGGLKQ